LNPDSRIFIAGDRGLVGSALVRKLQSLGYSNLITRTRSELDLGNQRSVNDFFAKEKPEYVFLAAAKVGGILANSTYKADFIYENIQIAANVLKASHKQGVKKLLNLGSSCIYPKMAPQPMREDHLLTGPLEPTNEPYAIAKIAAIKMCRYFNEQYGTNFISAMPTNLYGPNDNFNLETSHVLPALVRKFHLAKLLAEKKIDAVRTDLKARPLDARNSAVAAGEEEKTLGQFGIFSNSIRLWGSGSPKREFLHVDDMADACVSLMLHQDAEDVGELINVGSGTDLSIRELAEWIKGIVGYKGAIEFDTSKPDGTPRKLLDVSRMKAFGWTPKISLEEGIRNTYRWYCERLGIG
jgi:GDP-L-fucose synthase